MREQAGGDTRAGGEEGGSARIAPTGWLRRFESFDSHSPGRVNQLTKEWR